MNSLVGRTVLKRAGCARLCIAVSGALLSLCLASATASTSAEAEEQNPPSAVAPADQAWSAWQQGDFGSARHLWQLAATRGDASAQYNLGVLYAEGRGVVRNPEAAIKWWTLAAQNNHRTAQHNLALARLGGESLRPGHAYPPQKAEAVRWLQQAAAGNFAPSQFLLGRIYLEEPLSPEKRTAAFDLIKAAANNNHGDARYFLAGCHLDGCRGLKQDKREGVFHLLTAARNGHADSQVRLSELYEFGLHVGRDPIEALAWSIASTEQGVRIPEERQFELRLSLSSAEIAAAHARANELSSLSK